MRIVFTPADLAFFDSAPETLHAAIEPATDCNGAACHAPGAPHNPPVPHLHLKLMSPDRQPIRIQYIEIEG